ncbi:uncharacterized protein LY89DRAFT_236650 [Mollisia scopiformis]|uniref:Uncharacterized protein n=1 Tax=Mollisia scopiformis TaxID=149040 RepID=A0A194WT11_MOLSC|nr:uncharacterized protein LY89DRAFT_236650 [Mollisia scopiformis]KUJ11091.1 hypothetical protein LY89DRAFT_236650 [Mollisia scopiformis]
MRTLFRMESGFNSRNFRRSTNSSQSSLQKPTMTGPSKKWFKPSLTTSSSSKKKSRTNTSLSTQSQTQTPFQQPREPQSQPQNPFQEPPPSQSQQSSNQDRPPPPTYTTSMPTPSSSGKPSKRSKAWKKTKEFLSSIGEPPTAEYDRQQAALRAEEGKVKTSGREAFGAVNYGPYHQGGPYQGGRL